MNKIVEMYYFDSIYDLKIYDIVRIFVEEDDEELMEEEEEEEDDCSSVFSYLVFIEIK